MSQDVLLSFRQRAPFMVCAKTDDNRQPYRIMDKDGKLIPIGSVAAALNLCCLPWLPISSAPDDARDVLIYDASQAGIGGDSDYGLRVAFKTADGDYVGPGEEHYWPTHWMPLPPPPGERL